MDFNKKIFYFSKKFEFDGWKLKYFKDKIYCINERKLINKTFNEEIIFSNLFIDIDEVFEVPVLSGEFFTENGYRLSYKDLLTIIPENLDLGSISEREHPITKKAVFFIHPCNTNSFISPLVDLGYDYMITWITRYGYIFNYKLPKK